MFQLQLFFLLHCDEWDHVVALLRHKFVTGATLLQLVIPERLGILIFSLVPSDNCNTGSTCPMLVFTGTRQSDKR